MMAWARVACPYHFLSRPRRRGDGRRARARATAPTTHDDATAARRAAPAEAIRYDSIALLAAAPALRGRFFAPRRATVRGVEHLVIGASERETGVPRPAELLEFLEARVALPSRRGQRRGRWPRRVMCRET